MDIGSDRMPGQLLHDEAFVISCNPEKVLESKKDVTVSIGICQTRVVETCPCVAAAVLCSEESGGPRRLSSRLSSYFGMRIVEYVLRNKQDIEKFVADVCDVAEHECAGHPEVKSQGRFIVSVEVSDGILGPSIASQFRSMDNTEVTTIACDREKKYGLYGELECWRGYSREPTRPDRGCVEEERIQDLKQYLMLPLALAVHSVMSE